MLGNIEYLKNWDWNFVALVEDTTLETEWYILLPIKSKQKEKLSLRMLKRHFQINFLEIFRGDFLRSIASIDFICECIESFLKNFILVYEKINLPDLFAYVGNDSDFRRYWFRAKFVAKSLFETFFQYVNAFSIQSFAKVADQWYVESKWNRLQISENICYCFLSSNYFI